MSQTAATTTEALLRSIADHLSSRPECRRMNYGITISEFIYFQPTIWVYPDKYTRTPGSKQLVADHVLSKHFPELISEISSSGIMRINTTKVVPGSYQYCLSATGKKRKWIRVG